MPLSTTENRKDYAGNGVTTVFSFPYKFFSNDDLTVIEVDDATGAETTKTITTHYTVAGAGEDNGGTVTMVTAPATGKSLVILREVELTQEVDLVDNDSLPAASVEQIGDKAMMAIQQQQETLSRVATMPKSVPATVFNPQLPTGLAGAPGTALIVNATGDGFDVGPTATAIAAAQTNATAAAAAKTAAEAAQAAAEAAQDAAEATAASFNDANLIHKTGDETKAGVLTLTSSPILPTPAVDDSSTKGATTAFVIGQGATATPAAAAAAGAAGSSTRFSRGDHIHPYPSQLSTASGNAPSYGVRAFVNFNGTGTVAINAAGNVSSITDNATGDYTLNFTTALPDAHYAVAFGGVSQGVSDGRCTYSIHGGMAAATGATLKTTTQLRIFSYQTATNAALDSSNVSVMVIR